MTQDAILRIKNAIGSGKVFTDRKSLLEASIDNSRYSFFPDAVVKAESGDDISKTLKIANEEKIFVCPRGAGSGCCGAALHIVFSLHWQ